MEIQGCTKNKPQPRKVGKQLFIPLPLFVMNVVTRYRLRTSSHLFTVNMISMSSNTRNGPSAMKRSSDNEKKAPLRIKETGISKKCLHMKTIKIEEIIRFIQSWILLFLIQYVRW